MFWNRNTVEPRFNEPSNITDKFGRSPATSLNRGSTVSTPRSLVDKTTENSFFFWDGKLVFPGTIFSLKKPLPFKMRFSCYFPPEKNAGDTKRSLGVFLFPVKKRSFVTLRLPSPLPPPLAHVKFVHGRGWLTDAHTTNYNIDWTLRALWLVKNLCFIRV